MTQQDETGQAAATDQSPPPRPSPYLDRGESVPDAYLAPPQPGEPSFGSAPAYRPGLRARGAAGQPYAPSGYGQQSANGQPRYGQAGNRSLRGAQSRRDPAIAMSGERLFAAAIDWIIICVASVLPYWSLLTRVARDWHAIVVSSQYQSSAAFQAAINNFNADPATQHLRQYVYITIVGLAFAYFWVLQAAWGATLGKRLVGLRVVQANDQAQIGVKAAGFRAAASVFGPAVCLLAAPLATAGAVLWASDTGFGVLDLRAQCLHDKVAGTIVVRQRWLDRQARSSRPW